MPHYLLSLHAMRRNNNLCCVIARTIAILQIFLYVPLVSRPSRGGKLRFSDSLIVKILFSKEKAERIDLKESSQTLD